MGWGGGATGWWRYPTYRKFAYCFPHPPSPGRFQGHFTDKGYNAIQLAYAANCWVRNVRIQNADNGLLVSSTNFVTVDGECGWCCQHLVLAGNGSQPAVERQMRPAVGLVGTACYQGHRNRARRAFQEAAEQAAWLASFLHVPPCSIQLGVSVCIILHSVCTLQSRRSARTHNLCPRPACTLRAGVTVTTDDRAIN